MIYRLIFIILSIFLFTGCSSKETSSYQLPYKLYEPSIDTQSDKTYPLVLFLHGAGERGDDNELPSNTTGCVPFLTDFLSEKQIPAYILVPQCPREEQWVNVNWEDGSYSLDDTPISQSLAYVHSLLMHIISEYPIDPDRIYITGVSMGSFGSYDLMMRYPDIFAAGILLCGAGDPTHASDISHIPLMIFHGARDKDVPVEGSKSMTAALSSLPASDFHYTEYPDVGHGIWLISWEEEGLFDWLFQQKKGYEKQ